MSLSLAYELPQRFPFLRARKPSGFVTSRAWQWSRLLGRYLRGTSSTAPLDAPDRFLSRVGRGVLIGTIPLSPASSPTTFIVSATSAAAPVLLHALSALVLRGRMHCGFRDEPRGRDISAASWRGLGEDVVGANPVSGAEPIPMRGESSQVHL